ncbi:PAS domain S-box protein [Brasilonema sp. CT11]|nr:PAS domain S-box protein [Brasilonema sp. CT11]
MSANLTNLTSQLRATLGKMEVALGAIADAIVWTGGDGKVQWCNAAFDKLVSQPHILLLNMKLSDLLPLKQAGEAVAPESYPNMRVLGGKYEATEYEFQQGDCSLILEISGSCAELPEGDSSAVLVIRDVTKAKHREQEHKLAEQERAETLSLLRATLESTADGIIVVNQNFNVSIYNQKFLQMWSLPEVLLQPSRSDERFRFMAEQTRDPEAFIGRVKELFFERPEQQAFDLVEMKDGRVFERYSQPQWRSDKIIGRVWSFRDITKRKQVEEALLKSEQKFRHIFENSQVGIFRSRIEDGLIIDANQRFAQLLGYSCVADIIGTKFTRDFYANPSDRQSIINQLRQEGSLNNFEIQFRRCDGERRWGLFSLRLNIQENCIEAVGADICARKQAEANLRRSNAILKAQQEASIDGILVVDENNRVVSYNQRFCQLWQIPETLIHSGRDRLLLESVLNQLLQPEEFLAKVEYLYAHPQEVSRDEIFLKDGRTLDRYSASVHSPAGDHYGRIWYFRDITERKQIEESLRLSEARFRALYESNNVSVILGDENGIFDCNSAATQLIGYSRQEMLGKHFAEFSPSIQPNGQESMSLANQHGALAFEQGSHRFEWIHRRADATEFPAEVWLTAVEVGNHKLMQVVVQDLTERKQAEAVLQHSVRVDNLLTSISRQFIDQDVDTAINFTLSAIAEFLGTQRCCIFEYSDKQELFNLVHEWRAVGIKPLFGGATSSSVPFPWLDNQILRGNSVQISNIADLPLEAAFEKAVFQSQSIQSVVVVPTIHSGKVVGFLGTDVVNFSMSWKQEDINLLQRVGELIAIGRSRYQAEEALRVAKVAAETANRAKSAFLANMSHELRTPLNAILGFSQLMERDTTLTKRQRESLATINRSGEHLLNLINDVLEMSKIEAGRIVLNPVSFDFYQLLQSIQEMFKIRAEAKKLLLQVKLVPNLPQYILTDEGKLQQVLINLLGNAIKFTNTGGVTLRVGIRREASEIGNGKEILPTAHLLFEIEDTGKGIAPEELDNLFQPFVQTASATQVKEGTGLGLTISRQFVQLMGGDIRLKSEVNRGSTFDFDIKVELAESFEVAAPIRKEKVIGLTPGQRVYRILVADDRKENCDLLTQLLNSIGFETHAAANGQEAIAHWQTWHPDLIWMDMRMPVMNGYEATRQIRAAEQATTTGETPSQYPRTVIIALTASAFEEQRSSILGAGCDDLIRKPFREEIIFNKMAEYLGVQYVYAEQQENFVQTRFTRQAFTEVSKTEDCENLLPSEAPDSNDCRPVVRTGSGELTPQDLLIMPSEWITALHQAAVEVDAELIFQLIDVIPKTHHTVAQELTNLVDRFCFDEIIDLIPDDNGQPAI